MIEISSLCLRIAGLDFRIECTDPDLLALLAGRYAAFLSPSERGFYIRIDVASRSGTVHDLSGMISFQDGIRFRGQDVEGYIDESHERAELRFSSRFGFELADYFLRVILAVVTFRAGGLMLHAAGIVREGRAYLFFGHSGSGKTTISRLSVGDLVLNDDLVVLMPAQVSWQVHATPFWNPSQFQPAPGHAGLAGFFHLVQDQRVYLDPMSASQAAAELIASTPVLPACPERNAELLNRIDTLIQAFPCYQLHFLPDATFWPAIENSSLQFGQDNLN